MREWCIIAVAAAACWCCWWWLMHPRQPRQPERPRQPRAANLQDVPLSVSGVWYMDEASHTGDLVLMQSACTGDVAAGVVVLHPDTGEPWLVEAAPGGDVAVTPARDRVLDHPGVSVVVPIKRPVDVPAAIASIAGDGGRGEYYAPCRLQ